MLDLRICVLTHPASVWDVKVIERECLTAFAGHNLSVETRVFSNHPGSDKSLSPFRYLGTALAAQLRIGSFRLAKEFSLPTLWWQIRQVVGLLTSLARLVSPHHRRRVRAESARAFRIANGHSSMWRWAVKEPARLHLFLEDDVTLASPEELVRLTKSLLEGNSLSTQYVCDASHSYSLREIGVDPKRSVGNQPSDELRSYNFPFTNTLAASFLSPELLRLTVTAVLDRRVGRDLGINLDVMQLWSRTEFKVAGCIAMNQVFQQQSGFRSQKI